MSTKNSLPLYVFSPPGPRATISPSSARKTAGRSPAGSAWARLPPSVPLLRTWRSPTTEAASARAGSARLISGDAAIWAWVTSAPIVTPLPSTRISFRPGMRPMSISVAGWARRSFIIGSRLWPPAIILASPPLSESSLIASSSEVGRTYSNWAGYMPISLSPSSGPRARHLAGRVLDRLDDVLIAGAAAEVALDALADLFLGRGRVVLQQVHGRHDHAGRAEPALEPVLLPEAALDRV